MVPVILVYVFHSKAKLILTYHARRPKSKEITESLLTRAKMAGFTALVVTLDTMILGWRPHDLEKAFIPFGHGFGIRVGESDPVFMRRYGKEPIPETTPQWPYQPDALDKKIAEGDQGTKERTFLGMEWIKECNSNFKSWDDLKHLRQFWDGPLILKGIQHAAVRKNFLIERPIWIGITKTWSKRQLMDFVCFRMPKELWNTGLMGSLCQTMVGSRKSTQQIKPIRFLIWFLFGTWFGKIQVVGSSMALSHPFMH